MAFGKGNAGDSLRKNGLGVGKRTTNKSYQKFYDGWVEYREEDEKGKEKRCFLYVADYHVCDLDMKTRVLVRVLYVLLLAAAAVLYVSAGVRSTSFNLTWYVGIPIAVTCVLLAWTAITLVFYYIPGIKRMTNFSFGKAVDSFRNTSRFSVYSLLACAVMTVFSLFFHREDLLSTFLCAAQYIIAAGAMLIVYLVERRIGYHLEPSGNVAPIGSIYVSTMEEILPPKEKEERKNEYDELSGALVQGNKS